MRFKFWLMGLTLILLFFVASSVFAMDAMVKDNWMVAEQDNKPVGIRHQQLWRIDTGYKYLIDYSFQIGAPDGTVSQFIKHWELAVDKQYIAKSFHVIDIVNGSVTHIYGEFNNNQVKITRMTADGQETVNNLQTEQALYYSYSYYDYISFAGKLETGQTGQTDVFDLDTLSIVPFSFTVEKNDTFKVKGKNLSLFSISPLVSPTGESNPSVLVNSKGDYYWWNDSIRKITCRKIERNEIKVLQELPLLYFGIAGNSKVLSPLRSITSRIRVTWNGMRGDDFQFEDNRQKLGSSKETVKNEALIIIQKDERDFSGKTKLPVIDKKLTSYLANDSMISPLLPAVKELAGNVLGGETDGWLAAQKLVVWVHDSIQAGTHSGILSTKQILEQKNGQSFESAIIFAALARSAGLPTRIAYGLRYQDEVWLEHYWNEIWLGEWIAIDPSRGQSAPDSLLLKLFQSDSAPDIRKLREKILGNLTVSIDEIRLAEVNETEITTVKTGVYSQTYINQEFGCTLKVPEKWQLIETKESDEPVLVMQSLSNKDITGLLIMFKAPSGKRISDVLGERFPELKDALTQYDLGKQQPDFNSKDFTLLSDVDIVTPEGTTNGPRFHQQNWIIEHGDNGYMLVLLAPQEVWQGCEAEFQTIRQQFQVFEKQ